MTFINKV